jgi:hypothetical protein
MGTSLAAPNGAGSVRALILVASASPHALEDLASVAISRELAYSAAGRGFGYTQDTTLNVYTQVIDGAARTAADKVGFELFTIVHNPEKASELTH